MVITGNKGEWSELYVLLRLLADGKLFSADENLRKIVESYLPILSIYRKEFDDFNIEYRISDANKIVELYINDNLEGKISTDKLKLYADLFLRKIQNGGNRAFEIERAPEIMRELHCTKIKAPSTDKTDIKMKIHDKMTNFDWVVGYSIKSELGSPPTLLNASGATNFKYEVIGISQDDSAYINDIYTKASLVDRVGEICRIGKLKYIGPVNTTFKGNLELIDSRMDEIIGHVLLSYYRGENKNCIDLANELESKDPLQFGRNGIYQYKIKKLLAAVALGMKPSTRWDGLDEANGGYIIVKEDGNVLAYHLYNRNQFEQYLLHNTKLETGSTTKHGFGFIYDEENRMYINLNLQVRFI